MARDASSTIYEGHSCLLPRGSRDIHPADADDPVQVFASTSWIQADLLGAHRGRRRHGSTVVRSSHSGDVDHPCDSTYPSRVEATPPRTTMPTRGRPVASGLGVRRVPERRHARRQLAFDLLGTLGAQEVSPILGLVHYRLEEIRIDPPGLHPLLVTREQTVLFECLTDVRQDASNGWLGLLREVLIAQYQQAERPVAGHLESGTRIRLPPLAEHLRVDIGPRRFTGVDLKTSQVRTQRVDRMPNDVEESGPGKGGPQERHRSEVLRSFLDQALG